MDAEGEYTCNRSAKALEKPKSNAAAKAPAGRQPPKINAASAMKPRPSVMLLMNVPPPNPSERYTPPSDARAPEIITQP